jgi:4'-phosphopantetheinyl transferase
VHPLTTLIEFPKHRPPTVKKIASIDFRPGRIPLPTADLDLWHIDLDGAAHAPEAERKWRALLSPDERERADRFRFDQDRQRFSATRALLRILLAAYLDTSPEQMLFAYSEKEKPRLAGSQENSGLAFNVSHSGSAALLGFSLRSQLGVDVEKIRSDFDTDAIAKRFFSPAEQEQLSRVPVEQRHRDFFRCWTLKEAFIKALGEGLSHPLHQFDVSLDASTGLGTPVRLGTRPDAREAERWCLQTVDMGPDYAAAYAISRD